MRRRKVTQVEINTSNDLTTERPQEGFIRQQEFLEELQQLQVTRNEVYEREIALLAEEPL